MDREKQILRLHAERNLPIGQDVEAVSTSGWPFEVDDRRGIGHRSHFYKACIPQSQFIFNVQGQGAADSREEIYRQHLAIESEPSWDVVPGHGWVACFRGL